MPGLEGQSPVSSAILDRLPGRSDAVRRLIAEDEHFQSLCEDYALAIEALGRFAGGSRPGDRDRQREYAALIVELEAEIEGVIAGVRRGTKSANTGRAQ